MWWWWAWVWLVAMALVGIQQWFLLLLMVATLGLWFLWVIYRPLNLTRTLTQVGWDHVKEDDSSRMGLSKRQLVRAKIKQKMAPLRDQHLPPAYPNGWFALLESHQVAPGQVKSSSAIGQEFVVWRNWEGEVRVMDAYCPHLGANIGVGGKVEESDCITCPFHGWRFSGKDGRCVKVPYANKAAETARVGLWESMEAGGWILVWYHAEGTGSEWAPQFPPEVTSGRWLQSGRTEHWVGCHIQELPENGADTGHFNQIHSEPAVFSLGQHVWTGQWHTGDEESNGQLDGEDDEKGQLMTKRDKHVAYVQITHHFQVAGFQFFFVDVEIMQVGPSFVFMNLHLPFGTCWIIQAVTPVEPLLQRVVHHIYAPFGPLLPLYKTVLWAESVMLERDIRIWNSKQFLSRPLIVAEEKSIRRFRRWFNQFYSENSPRINAVPPHMDW